VFVGIERGHSPHSRRERKPKTTRFLPLIAVHTGVVHILDRSLVGWVLTQHGRSSFSAGSRPSLRQIGSSQRASLGRRFQEGHQAYLCTGRRADAKTDSRRGKRTTGTDGGPRPSRWRRWDRAGLSAQFPGFVRTREAVLRMMSMREEKSSLPFNPGSSCPGGQGTRRVEGVENDSAGAPFPRVSWQGIGRGRFQKFKNLREGTRRKSAPRVKNFRKAAPQKAPRRLASKNIIGSLSMRVRCPDGNFFLKGKSPGVGRHWVGGGSAGTVRGLVVKRPRLALGRRSAGRVSRFVQRDRLIRPPVPGRNREMIPGRFLSFVNHLLCRKPPYGAVGPPHPTLPNKGGGLALAPSPLVGEGQDGGRNRQPPGVRQSLNHSKNLLPLIRQRYLHAWHYGSERSRRFGPIWAIARTILAPLVPLALLARIGRNLASKKVPPQHWLRAFPFLLPLLAAWSLGEVVGYWIKPPRPRGIPNRFLTSAHQTRIGPVGVGRRPTAVGSHQPDD
jgi:hypothetical protein